MKRYQIKPPPPLHHCPSCDTVAEQAGKGRGLKVGIFASGGQLYSRKSRGAGGPGGRWVLGLTCPAELQAVLLSLCSTDTQHCQLSCVFPWQPPEHQMCAETGWGGGGGEGGEIRFTHIWSGDVCSPWLTLYGFVLSPKWKVKLPLSCASGIVCECFV